MLSLNWDAFAQLPGSAESNFEMLCRALIRRNYGKYGDFRALASQPGVEFHLRLTELCALGEPGRWYGWQCRWYDLPGGRAIGTTRRRKIEKALRTTERVLPDITDWVLWTRRPLTEGDQEWFHSLKTAMRLNLWAGEEVQNHLTGDAEILKGTYFGEFVLVPDALARLHDVSVAPILRRWNPLIHQTIDSERKLRRMLGELGVWNALQATGDQLSAAATAFDSDRRKLRGPLSQMAADFSQTAHAFAAELRDVFTALDRGDLDLLRQQLAARSVIDLRMLSVVLRRLRAGKLSAALTATNSLALIRDGSQLCVKWPLSSTGESWPF
jgi:hypothetical protein